MGLMSKEVVMKWNGKSKKWYEERGYKYTKQGDEFEVKVEDLPRGSEVKVSVKCDGCEKILKDTIWKSYSRYVKEDGKYYCKNCMWKIQGVDNCKKTRLKNSKSFFQWCKENLSEQECCEVLERWDYELNYPNTPENITYCSKGFNKKGYWFKCSKGIHKSEQKDIQGFVSRQKGSLYCNECNSFEQWCYDNLSKEKSEEILSRWDYEKNIYENGNIIKPSDVSYSSKGLNQRGYWFKCLKHSQHKSELKNICNYIKGFEGSLECNQCGSFGQYLLDKFGEDGINTYWSDKNKINPFEISKCSGKKVWVKCIDVDYHEDYQTTCDNFSINDNRCPYCTNTKIHPKDSLGQYILNNYGQEFLDKIWSSKNKKSAFEYAPFSMSKIWWVCYEDKHGNYLRSIKDSNVYEFRCPVCVEERKESFLQEKVRTYLESLGYNINHEYGCNIIAQNPKIRNKTGRMPYDNEVVELRLVVESMGKQHYLKNTFNKINSRKNNTNPEQELFYRRVKDRYKRLYAKSQGYYYLEIPYWTDNVKDEWKKLIDNKINEIKSIIKIV